MRHGTGTMAKLPDLYRMVITITSRKQTENGFVEIRKIKTMRIGMAVLCETHI